MNAFTEKEEATFCLSTFKLMSMSSPSISTCLRIGRFSSFFKNNAPTGALILFPHFSDYPIP